MHTLMHIMSCLQVPNCDNTLALFLPTPSFHTATIPT